MYGPEFFLLKVQVVRSLRHCREGSKKRYVCLRWGESTGIALMWGINNEQRPFLKETVNTQG